MQTGNIRNYSQELLDEVRSKKGQEKNAVKIFREGNEQNKINLIADTGWGSSGWTVLHWAAYRGWNTLIRSILHDPRFHAECFAETNPPWFSGYLKFLGIFNGNQTPAHVACLSSNPFATLLAIKNPVFADHYAQWAEYYTKQDALGRSLATEPAAESLAPFSGPTIYTPVLEQQKAKAEEYEEKIDRAKAVIKNGNVSQVATYAISTIAVEAGLSADKSKNLAEQVVNKVAQQSEKTAEVAKLGFKGFLLKTGEYFIKKSDPGDEKQNSSSENMEVKKNSTQVSNPTKALPSSPRPKGVSVARAQFSSALQAKTNPVEQKAASGSNSTSYLASLVNLGASVIPRFKLG